MKTKNLKIKCLSLISKDGLLECGYRWMNTMAKEAVLIVHLLLKWHIFYDLWKWQFTWRKITQASKTLSKGSLWAFRVFDVRTTQE